MLVFLSGILDAALVLFLYIVSVPFSKGKRSSHNLNATLTEVSHKFFKNLQEKAELFLSECLYTLLS